MKNKLISYMYSVTKRTKTVIVVLLLALLTLLMIPTVSYAIPDEGDNPIDESKMISSFDSSIAYKYAFQKTLDISDTNVDIYITPQEQEQLKATATDLALSWLGYILAFDSLDDSSWSDTLKSYADITKRYWYENVDITKLNLPPERQTLVNKLIASKKLNIIDSLTDAEFNMVKNIGNMRYFTDKEKLKQTLKYKATEIYNDKFSDVLVDRLTSKLKVNAHFKIESLASDGSEDEQYGINPNEGIYRGTQLSTPLQWNVDFTGKNQFYDAVLSKFMLNNTIQSPFGKSIWNSSNTMLEDGRDLVDHILLLDGGMVWSSDDSQYGYSGLRDVTPDYPGWHCLLEVCDGLGSYDWARYGIPGSYYSTFYNLHLNPVVEYFVTTNKKINAADFADVITKATFDDKGRLLTISKPLFPLDTINQILAGSAKEEAHGLSSIYRYKLIETKPTVESDNLKSDDFDIDGTSLQYIDVVNGKDGTYIMGINGKTVIGQNGPMNQINAANGELINKATTIQEQKPIPKEKQVVNVPKTSASSIIAIIIGFIGLIIASLIYYFKLSDKAINKTR